MKHILSRNDSAQRISDVDRIASQLCIQLQCKNWVSKICKMIIGPAFLTLTIRIIMAFNLYAQFLIMKNFFGAESLWFPWDILHSFRNLDGDWRKTGYFPRVTWCKVVLRPDSNSPKTQLMQCILVMNTLYEKIIIVIWCWLSFLVVITALHFILSLFSMLGSKKFVLSIITRNTDVPVENLNSVWSFCKFLSIDGIFLIHRVWNIDHCITCQIVEEMYRKCITDIHVE